MQARPTTLAHAHGASLSTAIGKFHKAYRVLLSRLTHVHVGDADIVHFKLKMHVYELISGALDNPCEASE
jgi:hypothetical protein